jgi:hypothetical protein
MPLKVLNQLDTGVKDGRVTNLALIHLVIRHHFYAGEVVLKDTTHAAVVWRFFAWFETVNVKMTINTVVAGSNMPTHLTATITRAFTAFTVAHAASFNLRFKSCISCMRRTTVKRP